MRADTERFFSASVPLPHLTPQYRLSVVAVAIAMVLLPVLYVGFVVLWGWAVFLYATTAFPFVVEHVRNWQIIALAATPILAGLITTVFLLKPFFGRQVPPPQPLSIAPADAPGLFRLVDELCDALGSPRPRRIDVDIRVNASAGLRRGVLSLFSNDLVLTIGLPLVDGLTLRQFTGVLAHEFGHFSQGAGMRLGFIIRSINAWFAGVVYGRDHWDARLERWGQDATTWIVQVVLGAAVLCVSLSRRVLRLLMQGGEALSMLLSRQMEFDADQAEVRAVGSTTFADTSRRLHVLDMASRWAHSDLGVAWRKRQLSDDFPALVQANLRQMSPSQIEQMLSSAVHSTPSMYDSHPPTEQRIARATSPHWDGVFIGDGDPRTLFTDFKGLCVNASTHYYGQLLPGEFAREQLVPAEHVAALGETEAARRRASAEYFSGLFDGSCWLVLPEPPPSMTPEQVGTAFAASRTEIAAAEALRGACDRSFARIIELRRLRAIADADVPIQAAAFRLASAEPRAIEGEAERVTREWQANCDALRTACPHLLSHLASTLPTAPPEVTNALRSLEQHDHLFNALINDLNALGALLVLQETHNKHGPLGPATTRAHDRLVRSLTVFRSAVGELLDPVPAHLDVGDQAQLTIDQTGALHASLVGRLAQHALDHASGEPTVVERPS